MTSVLYRSPLRRYLKAVRANGMYIEDQQGKQYLDMSGGAAVSCVGHAHPYVVKAVQKQLDQLTFAHTSFFTNEPQEQLAKSLAARFGDPEALVYFTSGGSEANETALKICWQYWRSKAQPDKKIIISREHSYHGNTLGALSISGNEGRRRASASPLLNWPRVSPCYAHRDQRNDETVANYVKRVAGELQTAIKRVGAEHVAAFICEPVVGSSLGVVEAEPGYLALIREICDKYDILFIADEIMCGSGRTGSYFAFEHDKVKPDIVTLAKGIGGGYIPLAATIMSGKVSHSIAHAGFTHGHTYIGNPLACMAGCAVQDVLNQEQLLLRTKEMGTILGKILKNRFSAHPNVGDIRGRGLFWALELVSDRDSGKGFKNGSHLPGQLRNLALDAGLICYPGGITIDETFVPHIMLAPPMILQENHINECVERLAIVLNGAF